jgi:surfactin synthase thioesterase subunit
LLDVLSVIGFSNSRALEEDEELQQLLLPMLRGDFEAAATYSRDFKSLQRMGAPMTVICAVRDVFVPPHVAPHWGNYANTPPDYYLLDDHHYFVESRRDEVVALVRSIIGGQQAVPPGLRQVSVSDWHACVREGTTSAAIDPNEGLMQVKHDAVGVCKGTLALFPDILAAPFPLMATEGLDPSWRIVEFHYPSGVTDPRVVFDAFSNALVGDQPLVLAGLGFGAICAAELAARLPAQVVQVFAVNSIPPADHGLAFVDLLSDEELRRLTRVVGHPSANPSLSQVRSEVRLGSNYSSPTGGLRLQCPIVAIRGKRSVWVAFHTVEHWRLVADAVDVVSHDGHHFTDVAPYILERIGKA